ncbi:hypothetical protein JCM11641_006228 [Rhodosporidiobolus odoratus]
MAGARKSTSESASSSNRELVLDDHVPEKTTPAAPAVSYITKPNLAFEHVLSIPIFDCDPTEWNAIRSIEIPNFPLPGSWRFAVQGTSSRVLVVLGSKYTTPDKVGQNLTMKASIAAIRPDLSTPEGQKKMVVSDVPLNPVSFTPEQGYRWKAAFSTYQFVHEAKNHVIEISIAGIAIEASYQSITSQQITRAAERVAASMTVPCPHDVVLSFPRSSGNNLHLYASRSLLSASSSYYTDLLASGFAEATPSRPYKRARRATPEMTGEDGFEDDSGDETDEMYAKKTRATDKEVKDNLATAYHELKAPSAYSTYRAVLLYLQTNFIHFSPLRSASLPSNPMATLTRPEAIAARAAEIGVGDPPLAVSPKSTYRLAHYLRLDDLAALSLSQVRASLHVETCALELVTPTSRCFDEVQKVIVEFIVENLDAVEATTACKQVMGEIERGERMDAAPVLVKLLAAQRNKSNPLMLSSRASGKYRSCGLKIHSQRYVE